MEQKSMRASPRRYRVTMHRVWIFCRTSIFNSTCSELTPQF